MPTSASDQVLEDNFHLSLMLNNSKFSNFARFTVVVHSQPKLRNDILGVFIATCSGDFPAGFSRLGAIRGFVSRFERTLFRIVRKFSLISFISERSILNYFQKAPKTPLQAMSSAPTEEDRMNVVNLTARETEEVTKQFTVLENKGTKRGKYIKWSAEERAEIGQHVVRHGVNQTVRLLKGKYP